ncbi:hypothetical protein D3C81_2288400 [compost metagenome]
MATTATSDYQATVATVATEVICTYAYRLDGRAASNDADADLTNNVATRTIVYNTATGAVTTNAD